MNLQDGIDKAGSPMRMLWKPGAEPWNPEVVEKEYVGWRAEQKAWHEGVAISDLSHHMYDLFIEGPDATKLLKDVSANNYEKFAIGRAKQIVPVNADGYIVTDGILLRRGENEYTLSGVPASQHWVQWHGEQGGYDVAFRTDPSSAFRFDKERSRPVPLPVAGSAGAGAGRERLRRAAAADEVLPHHRRHARRPHLPGAAPRDGRTGGIRVHRRWG